MKPEIYGLWHGGHNYSVGTHAYLEQFRTLAGARRVFLNRLRNADGSTPCVDDTASMWIFQGTKPTPTDMYPDAIIKIGPRGGVVLDRWV